MINWQNFFQGIGLLLNFSGAFILALPLMKTKRDLDEDEIIKDYREDKSGKEKFYYTRRGFLKERKLGLWGLGLLGFGFLIQLLMVIL